MATWPTKPHANSIDSAHTGVVLRMLVDFLGVCRQSWAAADHYEDLKSMSDSALAEKGIERKDLARVAFDRLAEED